MKHTVLAKIGCLLLALLLLTACQPNGNPSGNSTTASTAPQEVIYTVTVKTEAGQVPVGAEYYVRKPSGSIATYGTLEKSGKITFTALKGENYSLELRGLEKIDGMAEGYTVEESYALTEENTDICLHSAPVPGVEVTGKVYKLGDIIRDFTVTDTDGNVLTVSELLKSKKCVVLNFWDTTCVPCKMEFPYLQKAYEAYSDQIALIGMDYHPKDTVESIAQYRADNGLSFPMAHCDIKWSEALDFRGNPTTIVIDRYGRICFLETGSVTVDGHFEALFEHFVKDDYQQVLLWDLKDVLPEEA